MASILAEAEGFVAAGFRAVKMRLGAGDTATDVARVRAVREAGIPVGISQAVDAAEILTVVDLLDREQLRLNAGTQFDPEVVESLLRTLEAREPLRHRRSGDHEDDAASILARERIELPADLEEIRRRRKGAQAIGGAASL